jgi:heptosyltransferase-3
MEERIERILVVVPAQLGDVLIVTPLIRAARARWPQALVDVIGLPGTLGLLAGNPDVHACIEMTRTGGLKGQLRQAASLWRRYDLGFVVRITDRAHLYGLVAARQRSSIVSPRGSRWKRWIGTHVVEQDDGGHYVMHALKLIRPWSALPASVSVVPPPAQPLPADLERQLRHPCVVVHVPSTWTYKQWPVQHYRELVQGLLAGGAQVVLTGSPSPQDRALVEAVAGVAAPPALIDAGGRLALPQVRALLDHADAYVGPDASITHLAAAVGVPVVTVYGPSLPDAFGPWPQSHAPGQPWQRRAQRQQAGNVIMLQGDDLPGRTCVPCARMGCEARHDSRSHCLDTLAADRVLAEVRGILARVPGGGAARHG